MGWQGQILRVDLTAGTCEGAPLNMDWAHAYLGQRGLGTKYMMEHSDPAADPLSPGNTLIFATGPLTGTSAATGGRYSVITKGALTGAIACSNSGGFFGAELKMAGWDMIVFEGRSKSPVYLFIENERARLLDARDLWGKSVWETEPLLKSRHQDPQIRVASIGRAGEAGVRFACVMNDLDRAAGRSGVGAVMGSKNLKAVAVRGTRGVTVADPGAFMEAAALAKEKHETPGKARLASVGTLAMIDVTQAHGSLPTRNSREVQFEGAGKLNPAAMKARRRSDGRANLLANKACFACTIGCGRISVIDPTHFSVRDRKLGPSGGLEYESGFALGPLLGVDDMEAATYANFVCNEHGMDPISFGGTLAAAMELFETGAITEKDTGGLPLPFGSARALVAMVDQTARGEGFGADLGQGSKRLCEKYGHPEFSMTVKGQEFPGYDGRAMQGMALAYATSNRGACHLRASPFEDDFARLDTAGKARIVKESQDEIAATDSSGLCAFPNNAMEDVAAQLNPACGSDWTADDLRRTGERIWNLERQFNLMAGLTGADDTLPERILREPAASGSAKGHVAELDKMLPEYYRLRGWDSGGVPESGTLRRLGLA